MNDTLLILGVMFTITVFVKIVFDLVLTKAKAKHDILQLRWEYQYTELLAAQAKIRELEGVISETKIVESTDKSNDDGIEIRD